MKSVIVLRLRSCVWFVIMAPLLATCNGGTPTSPSPVRWTVEVTGYSPRDGSFLTAGDSYYVNWKSTLYAEVPWLESALAFLRDDGAGFVRGCLSVGGRKGAGIANEGINTLTEFNPLYPFAKGHVIRAVLLAAEQPARPPQGQCTLDANGVPQLDKATFRQEIPLNWTVR